MCCVVRNFLLWKRGKKSTLKNLPPPLPKTNKNEKEKKNIRPHYTKRGNSSVLEKSPIIRVLGVIGTALRLPFCLRSTISPWFSKTQNELHRTRSDYYIYIYTRVLSYGIGTVHD